MNDSSEGVTVVSYRMLCGTAPDTRIELVEVTYVAGKPTLLTWDPAAPGNTQTPIVSDVVRGHTPMLGSPPTVTVQLPLGALSVFAIVSLLCRTPNPLPRPKPTARRSRRTSLSRSPSR